ncbi:unnamed protein product [Phyllotreta striolata]|uniref:ADP-ribosylation factor-binding protein GGA1 n=1 Tax=Phyllotreta striolata TaxID=444603 RepID=A0A9N9TM58_PHYSR|nr:unnamed protein product [Phyllotreta striolata]
MDLITQTSLEALLLKATSSKNLNFDTAAVEAFCALMNKEKDGFHIGVKVIASRLPNGEEKEMLQTLNVLDHCMAKCGTSFQNEIGKFRFLNELIKLVSPKYLGSQTPLIVKQKILQLLNAWSFQYPKEKKIMEALDMLRKQGVVRDIPDPTAPYDVIGASKKKSSDSIFHDEEKSKILQKLLQSKDPEDVQAANWLIKSMVKEDDKRAEMKSKTITELESVQNNLRLLNEMLDSYKQYVSSTSELDLIKELHENCQRLKPSVNKLIVETNHEEGMLADILKTNDELTATFEKYNILIVQGKQLEANESLLQFDSVDCGNKAESTKNWSQTDSVDVLCDVFVNSSFNDAADVLKPLALTETEVVRSEESKLTGFEELDLLGRNLLKENLPNSQLLNINPSRLSEKVPMNSFVKPTEVKQNQFANRLEQCDLDLNYLLESKLEESKTCFDTSDDNLVDISYEKHPENDNGSILADDKSDKPPKSEIKLNDISVKLETIKPSGLPPITILSEKNGLDVTLHLAKGQLKQGVNIFVITTVNKNELPLSDYVFQAVVPKKCKLKLQPPSSTNLPAYNPFLPPSAITQILLIANPESLTIGLKFIISYIMDEETITEMGEVDRLPAL